MVSASTANMIGAAYLGSFGLTLLCSPAATYGSEVRDEDFVLTWPLSRQQRLRAFCCCVCLPLSVLSNYPLYLPCRLRVPRCRAARSLMHRPPLLRGCSARLPSVILCFPMIVLSRSARRRYAGLPAVFQGDGCDRHRRRLVRPFTTVAAEDELVFYFIIFSRNDNLDFSHSFSI